MPAKGPPAIHIHPDGLPPGRWQIVWYGPLKEWAQGIRTDRIVAWARPVVVEAGSVARSGDAVRCEILVTDLPALPIGTVVGDEPIELLPLPGFEWRRAMIDWGVERLVVRSRFDLAADLLPPPADDSPEYDAPMVVAGSIASAFVFPCIAIFQFFWARSSTLVQMLLGGDFVDLASNVFDPARSGMEPSTGHARLWLRERLRDEDPAILASICLDPHAVEAARDIWRRLAVASHGDHSGFIQALPPYRKPFFTEVLCSRVAGSDQQRVSMVQAIRSCAYQPEFTSLEVGCDAPWPPGVRVRDDGDAAEPEGSLPVRSLGPPIPVPAARVGVRDVLRRGGSRMLVDVKQPASPFPALAAVDVERTRNVVSAAAEAGSGMVMIPAESGCATTAEDAVGSDSAPPGAVLRQVDSQGEDDARAKPQRPPPGPFDEATQRLLALQAEQPLMRVKGRTWTHRAMPVIAGTPIEGQPFFYPDISPEHRSAWLHLHGSAGGRYRRVLCLRVEFTDVATEEVRVRYLLDLEPSMSRDGENRATSMLLFWSEGDQPLWDEAEVVREVVEMFARRKSTILDGGDLPMLHRVNRKHPPHGQEANILDSLASC